MNTKAKNTWGNGEHGINIPFKQRKIFFSLINELPSFFKKKFHSNLQNQYSPCSQLNFSVLFFWGGGGQET